MPKYLLIMRGTDETNAAMMASIDEAMAATGRFIEAMSKAGVLLAAEGLDDPGLGAVVDFGGDAPVVTEGRYGRATVRSLRKGACARASDDLSRWYGRR